jgi:hypothetical protein
MGLLHLNVKLVLFMKVAAGITMTHNPFGEDYWASCLRENLTSSSYGEGLETDRIYGKAPRQSLTRQTALDELKTHLRGARLVLRSKTPELVRQEFYGLLLAHFAIRGLMHEAALKADADPDRLSFVHAVRVIRRKLPIFHAIPPRGKSAVP